MNKSVLDRNFHKNTVDYFINLLVVSLSTFLTIPICQTSMTSIYCSTSSPFTSILNCNSTSQISLAILGSINIIWVLATNIYFALYYYSRNPFSTSFLTCSSNWWNLGKFAIKIIPTFYFSYDSQLAYPVLFLVMMNGCYAGYVVIFRIIFPYYRYNFDLEKFLFYLEVLILLINSHFIVIYAVSRGQPASKSYITLFWIIGSALIAKIWHNYFVYLK